MQRAALPQRNHSVNARATMPTAGLKQLEAAHWRQTRLRALEALAQRLVSEQRFSHAAAAAMTAVAADPLRETSRGALIQVYLAEGNQSEAVHEFRRYAQLLRSELGLTPTRRLQDLVRHLGVA